jgi:hypothetical protein
MLVVGLALLLTGCAAGSSPAPPDATPASESALVFGSQICARTSFASHIEGASEIDVEHFSCTYAVNDSRLDGGRFEADVTTTFEPADAPAARWEATATITTGDGAWSGAYRGALVVWSTSPGEPYNYAEGSYTGSGAYEGLVYHELVAGSNATLTVTGSIEPAS